ncbi:MAG: type II/IV secretion system protein [Kiritimatiellae bacterium]|nr:type II/IV secretion system protein [Kiritimatiellia bacterium]
MTTPPKAEPAGQAAGPAGTFETFLVQKDYVQPEQLEALRRKIAPLRHDPEQVRALLCEQNVLPEAAGFRALAAFCGLPYVDLYHTTIDPFALRKVSADFVRRHRVIPFFCYGNELSVAVHEQDPATLDALRRETGSELLVHMASKSQIEEVIELHYLSHEVYEIVNRVQVPDLIADRHRSHSVNELADALIINAIKERATDVHIEPDDTFVRIRYRIDGVLQEFYKISGDFRRPLVARYKKMAGLPAGQAQRPQNGRIRFPVASRTFDLRLSTVATNLGEHAVVRLVDKLGVSLDLNAMLLAELIHRRVLALLGAPGGVFVVAGPAGGGKTTSCYAFLNHLTRLARNVVTVEDPVEYDMPSMRQMQVDHRRGLDFPALGRAALKQDPDAVFIGEIRDYDTAQIATDAAAEGHLVLVTVLANNAAQGLVRLVEMGVGSTRLAASVLAVLGQRLVRKTCPHCRVSYPPTRSELERLHMDRARADVVLFRGEGCPWCRDTGYFGRLALHELLLMTDEVKECVLRRALMREIESAAYPAGFRPMRYDGLKKALIGLTTLDEVIRLTTARDGFL